MTQLNSYGTPAHVKVAAVLRTTSSFLVIPLLGLASLSIAQQPTAPPADDQVAHFGTTVFSTTGFHGEIFHIRHWTKTLPKLENKKPVGEIYTKVLNVPPQQFTSGFPGVTKRFEWFAIDYETKFWVTTPGVYHFSLEADDAADLYIDDRLIIDNDGQHPPLRKEGSVSLASGVHRMRVPYYQGPRYQVALILDVIAPGERTWRVFNTEDFKPSAEALQSESQ